VSISSSRLSGLVALAATLAVMGGAGASPATAALAPGYGPIGAPVDPGFGEAGPGHLAVDGATGNVLVADPASNRVVVLAPDLTPGGTGTLLTEFPASGATGIAIDQSSHAVYVSESSQVERFVSDGAPTPAYTADPTFVSPLLAHYGGPIAVDPATHDLLVGDVDHVNRYSSAGLLLRSFDGSASPGGKFTSVTDIAAGATTTYVLNLTGNYVGNAGVSRIVQVDGQGGYERTVGASDTPVAIAVDGHDRLVTVGRAGRSAGGAQLSVFEGDTVGTVGFVPSGAHYIGGVAVDQGASGRAYVAVIGSGVVGGTTGVGVLGPGPAVLMDVPTNPGSATVHLTSLVNPEGSAVTAHFEYCSNRDPCATDSAVAWQQGPDITVAAGSTDVAVASDIAGLSPHTGYGARLMVVDAQAAPITVQSRTVAFTTADAPPLVTTGPVSDLSSSTAVLTGAVAPLGAQSTYYFEYGESASYGLRAPAGTATGHAGNGFTARPVGLQISGLKPGTTYHYRLVAANVAGSIAGDDRTLRTTAAGGAARAYEMVSPIDKQGIDVGETAVGIRAGLTGGAVVYTMDKQPPPGSQAAVFTPRVQSVRSADRWSATPLDLPLDNFDPNAYGGGLFFSTLAVSSDARRALVLSRDKLTDGAVQGGWNLYIREPGTSPQFVLIATDPLLSVLAGQASLFHLVGVSDDLRTTAFTNEALSYEAVQGDGVRLVSVLPDGSTPTGVTANADNLVGNDVHQISTDGSRIYFRMNDGIGVLYLREDGSRTVAISVSHRPGASSTAVGGTLLGASPDGRYVEFTTYCSGCAVDGLTTGAPDGPGVYRYDVVSDEMTFLAEDPDGRAEGGTTLPRSADNAIFLGLDYVHDGVVTKIADVPGASATLLRASDDGQYVALISTGRLTSFDNAGKAEAYRYHVSTGELVCVSCRTDGGAPTGNVHVAGTAGLERYKPRVVLDDGTVFFDTDEPLVDSDINGTRDIYEYRDDRAELVSRGTLPTSSQFADATPDGTNVFFTTDDRLVGQDRDASVDLYDARIGGGIAGQSPPPPSPPCAGSECREPASGPVRAASSPSERTRQESFNPPPAAKVKVSILSSSVTAKSLRLVVLVSDRGRIRVSGPRVRTAVRTAQKAGRHTLTVGLTANARAARKAHRKVKVAIKVALTPAFGPPAAVKLSRTLGK
jgi:hypothetical protein